MLTDVCSRIDANIDRTVELVYTYARASHNFSVFLPLVQNVSKTTSRNLDDLIESIILLLSPGNYLPSCKIYHFLWTYVPFVILLFGSFGNILAFVVLRHPSTRYVSAFMYLAARSIVDEIVLIVGLLRRWMDYLVEEKLENTTRFFCKAAQFAGTSSSLLSVWLTVLLTAERALVISFPLQGGRFITFTRVRKCIWALSFLCVAVSSHFFFTVDLVPDQVPHSSKSKCNKQQQNILQNVTEIKESTEPLWYNDASTCKNVCSYREELAFMSWLLTYLDATFYCYLPFSLIFGFNIIILYHVDASQKEHHSMRVRSDKNKVISQPNENNLRQLTIMLLVVSFSFLATTIFIVIMKILTQILDLEGFEKVQFRAAFQLADSVAELLMYVNHAMNFYLFCATGKRFRSRLLFLVSKLKRRGFWSLCERYVSPQAVCNVQCSQNCSAIFPHTINGNILEVDGTGGGGKVLIQEREESLTLVPTRIPLSTKEATDSSLRITFTPLSAINLRHHSSCNRFCFKSQSTNKLIQKAIVNPFKGYKTASHIDEAVSSEKPWHSAPVSFHRSECSYGC